MSGSAGPGPCCRRPIRRKAVLSPQPLEQGKAGGQSGLLLTRQPATPCPTPDVSCSTPRPMPAGTQGWLAAMQPAQQEPAQQ